LVRVAGSPSASDPTAFGQEAQPLALLLIEELAKALDFGHVFATGQQSHAN
jgi:hypothetical protein